MAEMHAAGETEKPTDAGPAGSRAVVVVPPLRAEPDARLAVEGQPIGDLPPLIEPIEISHVPAAATANRSLSRSLGRRPVRQRFLAPSTDAAVPPDDSPPPLAHLRSGGSPRRQPSRADEPAAPRRGDGGEAAAPARPKPRRWPRRMAAGAGIAAALALAVIAEIGIDQGWLARLRAAAAQFTGPPPIDRNAEPPADPARRAAYYAERAKAGDAESQLALAILYAKGQGVAQDYAAAAKWFGAAAAKGLSRAQYDLGVLYERGRGVPVDLAVAAKWYRKAAEQDHPLAQYNLAVAYTKGQGVRHDFFEAAAWYHRAADHGVVAAMVNLAILYERGEGVDRSAVDAYAWYRAAARRGSQPADRRADALLQAFSLIEQTQAEAKTASVALAIRDAVGDRARLAAQRPPAAAGVPGPALKSGFESEPEPKSGGEAAAETP